MSPVGSSVPQAFSALAVFREDRLVKDLMDRLNQVHTHIVVCHVSLNCIHRYRHQFVNVTYSLLVTIPSRHNSPSQQGVLIMLLQPAKPSDIAQASQGAASTTRAQSPRVPGSVLLAPMISASWYNLSRWRTRRCVICERLSQARDGLHTPAGQFKVARFTGECVYLQICGQPDGAPLSISDVASTGLISATVKYVHLQVHRLAQFRSRIAGRSSTGRVSTSSFVHISLARRTGDNVTGSVPKKFFQPVALSLGLKDRVSPMARAARLRWPALAQTAFASKSKNI